MPIKQSKTSREKICRTANISTNTSVFYSHCWSGVWQLMFTLYCSMQMSEWSEENICCAQTSSVHESQNFLRCFSRLVNIHSISSCRTSISIMIKALCQSGKKQHPEKYCINGNKFGNGKGQVAKTTSTHTHIYMCVSTRHGQTCRRNIFKRSSKLSAFIRFGYAKEANLAAIVEWFRIVGVNRAKEKESAVPFPSRTLTDPHTPPHTHSLVFCS